MSTPKRNASTQPPLQSSPTKMRSRRAEATSPPIRVSLQPRAAPEPLGTIAELDADRKQFQDELLGVLKEQQDMYATLVTQAARQRVADTMQNIVCAMAVLVAMSEQEWQGWVQLGTVKDMDAHTDQFIAAHGRPTRDVIEQWLQTARGEEARTGQARSFTTKQWQTRVAHWYGKRCMVTNRNTVEACHILADSVTRDGANTRKFLRLLGGFWPRDLVTRLRDMLRAEDHIPKNLVVLRPDVHIDWAKAKFAFKPEAHSPGRVVLTFVWLAPTVPRGGVEYHRHVEDTDAPLRQEPSNTDEPRPHSVQSGDRIILETAKPTETPVPSWELLKLQWDLQRIARAAASAGFLATIFCDKDSGNAGMSSIVDKEASEEEEDDFGRPVPEPTPNFTNFLLDEGVDQGLLTEEQRTLLKEYFLPAVGDRLGRGTSLNSGKGKEEV